MSPSKFRHKTLGTIVEPHSKIALETFANSSDYEPYEEAPKPAPKKKTAKK